VAPWPVKGFPGLSLVRPMLSLERQALRSFLTARGVTWREDPMNGEARFARTKLRNLWPQLMDAGLSKNRIADAASHLARARTALDVGADDLLRKASRNVDGNIALDRRELAAAPRELGLRVLATLLGQMADAAYRPRFERLESLFDSLTAAEFRAGRTLHGCKINPAPKDAALFGPSTVIISREGTRKAPARKPAARALRK